MTDSDRRAARGRQASAFRQGPTLDEHLTSLEPIFRAPPLTSELISAIKPIAPQYDFSPCEEDRRTWEADQNGSCWGEYLALAPVIEAMPRPRKVLEVGPGLGRSLVFFSKKLGWQDAQLHSYEGEGSPKRYPILGPRSADSFCGNIPMLRHVLDYNGIRNVTIFNAKETALAELPGPYDLLYSFYCIGFHWSLEHFVEDVLALMHDSSMAIFTVPTQFTPFPRLAELSFQLLDWNTVWPRDGHRKLLILSKRPLEQVL